MEDEDYHQRVSEFRQVFDMFDVNGDGALSTDELKALMEKMGKKVSHTEAYSIIDSLDDNSNGKLDFSEFLTLVLGADHHRSALICAFRTYDRDGDGYITIDEIEEALKTFGHSDIMEERLQEFIQKVDKDGNGQIDFKEFSEMLTPGGST